MTIAITQASFTGGEWAPSLYARTDLAKYFTAARVLKNALVHPHGGASNRPGTRFVCEVKDSSRKVRLIPFQFSVVQAYILEFGHYYMRVIKDGGQVVNPSTSAIVEISTPYAETDLEKLNFTQSADILYLVHPSHAPRKLSRTDHHLWSISTITFGPSISTPSLTTSGGTTYKYVITAVSDTGEESNKSNEVQANIGSTLSWSAVSTAERYYVYKNVSGVHQFLAEVADVSYVVEDKTPDSDKTAPEARDPFSGSDNYPGICTFYEQRLLFGRTNNKPQTIWGSQIGSFTNLNRSIPLRDDDAYEHTLDSMNEILWMVALNDMVIGTTGNEWKFTGGEGKAITPTNVNARVQGKRGSKAVNPIVVGQNILFVQSGGRAVRDFSYYLESDGYKGDNLSILANHLFRTSQVNEWAFQRDPDSIAWCVMSDGGLLGLTYIREHQIWAWHRHDTDGLFESVASIPNEDGSDEVYFVVKRTIDGVEKSYIEMMGERFIDRIEDPEHMYFVDCGLSYEGDPVQTFNGLDHLEGKSVAVLADGDVIPGMVVNSGSITLPESASIVHIGLPYTTDIETMDIEVETQDGSVQDKLRTIESVLISFDITRGAWVGPNASSLTEIAFRTDEDPGDPTRLYSVDKEVSMSAGDTRGARVFIRNEDPVAMTVLAVIPRLDYA